jgi:hypothetical protein
VWVSALCLLARVVIMECLACARKGACMLVSGALGVDRRCLYRGCALQGAFEIDGMPYQLARNNPAGHALHGGVKVHAPLPARTGGGGGGRAGVLWEGLVVPTPSGGVHVCRRRRHVPVPLS